MYVYFNQKWVHTEKTLVKLNMSFLIKDDELLEKYNEIWEKVKNIIKKKFDTELLYSEKYLKTKIKSYNGKINPNFQNNKIPKEGSQFICLWVILIDSVFKAVKNYYPQVFLKECKYVVNEKKITMYIYNDISSDSDRENSNEEKSDKDNSDEESSNERHFDKEIKKILT